MSPIKKLFLILVCAFTLIACAKTEEQEPEINICITTVPLYFDGNLYNGKEPLLYIENELYIPINAVDYDLSDTDDVENSAVSIVENEWGNYIKWSELSGLENYDCYTNESEGDEFLLVRKCESKFTYDWTKDKTICHAMGGIDGITVTNTLEAFLLNYDTGHVVFEVDFALTEDGDLVCVHDFSKEMMTDKYGIDETLYEAYCIPTKTEFDTLRSYAVYTLLDVNDIIDLMAQYPDIYIVTDTKENDTEKVKAEFQRIVEAADLIDKTEVLDRIIPQIYDEKMYDTIMELYPWKSMIYTTYYLLDGEYDEMEVLDFAYEHGIHVVTMYQSRGTGAYLECLRKKGIMAYVHTYNTEEERNMLYEKGFFGIYTDNLLPDK